MTTPIQLVIEGRDNSGGAFKSAGSALSKIGSIAAGILASQVFTKLAQGVVDFGTSIVTEAREAALGQAQLNAVLESTGGIAGVTANMVNQLADSLQYQSKYTDDAIIAGENMLLTFTNIGKDVFPAATQTILDMSTALGQDVTQSAMQLGKALNDPVEGVTALRRVGVKLTDQQEEQIKKMMKVGDVAGAQGIILKELATEFGGSAKSQVLAWDNIKKRVDNMKEAIGTALLPVIDKFGAKMDEVLKSPAVQAALENVINWIGTNLPVAFDKAMAFAQGLSDWWNSDGKTLADNVKAFVDNGLAFISGWWDDNGAPILANAKKLFNGIKNALAEMGGTGGETALEIFNKIKDWFTQNGPLITAFITRMADAWTTYLLPVIVVVWNTILPLINGIIDLILGLVKIVMQVFTGDWAGAWETAKETATKVFDKIIEAATTLIQGILEIFGTSVEDIAADMARGWQYIKDTIKEKLDGIKDGAGGFVENVKQKFTDLVNGVMTAGQNFITMVQQWFKDKLIAILDSLGINEKIRAQWQQIFQDVQAIIQILVERIKEKFTEFVEGVRERVATVIEVFTTIFNNVKDAVFGKVTEVKTSVQERIDNMIAAIKEKVTPFINAFNEIFTKVKTAIETKFIEIKTTITNKVLEFVKAIKDKITLFTEIGSLIVTSIQNGITGAWDAFVNWITTLVSDIVQNILASLTGGNSSGTSSTNSLNANGNTTQNYSSSYSSSPLYNFGTINTNGNGAQYRGLNMLDAYG